ncbi:helix-turn-helix domain-containing protein [Mesorhizobium sp. IMUNJ 23033]|uniref:helix-turn-helix domain-containing protein n=1 Tax=Mesorhizobium sp. IMUNJ 23033 TaxID=3378039 RepID=UPI00384B64C5
MAEPKPIYAPTPARAIGDKNLTSEELRILMALAVHDRLNGNGMGCYASHARLAALVGCHEKSLSRSLSALAGRGYISASRHPLNARLRVYRVIYTEFDAAYLKSIGSKPATNAGPFQQVGGVGIGNKLVAEMALIGNKPNPETKQNQYDDSVNILGETIIYPAEAGNISRESAPFGAQGAQEGAPGKSVGAILAMIERAMKEPGRTSFPDWWQAWLEDIVAGSLEYGSPDYGRAFRLAEELGARLDAA